MCIRDRYKIFLNKYVKKLRKNNSARCVRRQMCIRDRYIAQSAKSFGFDIKLVSFVNYEKGEGLEKRQDDFAAEVASMNK